MKKIITLILYMLLTSSLSACDRDVVQQSDSTVLPKATDELSHSDMIENADIGNGSVTVQYIVGDIILADDSIVKAADITTIDDSNLPVAVIAGIKDDGTVLGVGVHRSNSSLQWASDESTGYTTKFTDIVCTQTNIEDAVSATFKGDMDGSDNWEIICSEDRLGSEDALNNYPALNFVNTYAENYKLTGAYIGGWYMPSIAELCTVYKNREAINTSLQKIYKIDNSAAMNGLGTNWYWSSSQSDFNDDYVWFVHYFNGYVCDCPKNLTNLNVLVVRTF